jgi:hypothetical protein
MKLIAVFLSILLLAYSQTASCDDSIQRNWGVSFKNLSGLYIRKSLSETALMYAGIGLGKGQQYYSSDAGLGTFESTSNDTSYTGILGIRKYLSNEKLSKFINLEVLRGVYKSDYSTSSSTVSTSNADAQSRVNSTNISYGIEYFLSSRISIEGAAGIGMYWSDGTNSSGSYSANKGVSLPIASIALSYYW